MAGREDHRVVRAAHGRRNAVNGKRASRSTRRERCGRNAGRRERQGLFAAASENEGVAALQPQHALALAGKLDQPLADVLLRDRGLPPRLPANSRRAPSRAKDEDGGSTSAS